MDKIDENMIFEEGNISFSTHGQEKELGPITIIDAGEEAR